MNTRKAKYRYYITSCYASGYVIVEVHNSCSYQIQTISICFNIMTFICWTCLSQKYETIVCYLNKYNKCRLSKMDCWLNWQHILHFYCKTVVKIKSIFLNNSLNTLNWSDLEEATSSATKHIQTYVVFNDRWNIIVVFLIH